MVELGFPQATEIYPLATDWLVTTDPPFFFKLSTYPVMLILPFCFVYAEAKEGDGDDGERVSQVATTPRCWLQY